MARKLKSVASRGSVNNIILASLMTGQKYGYEIIKEVEEKTNGKVKLKQPSLYSSLKRFETKNIITSYWGDSEIGGRRHYYLLTDYGKKYCEKLLNKNNDDIDNYDIEDDDIEEIEEVDEKDTFEKADQTNNDLDETNESSPTFEEESTYTIDEDGDDDVELNKKYSTFSVEDKMKELLGEDSEDESEPTEDEYSEIKHETHPKENAPCVNDMPKREVSDFQEDVRNSIIENNPTLTAMSDKKEMLNQLYDEIDKEEQDNPEEEYVESPVEEIIPDHTFYKPVPLSEYKNEKYEESYNILFNHETPVDHKLEEEKPAPVEQPASEVVATRKKKIITDEYGITKLVYEDEQNWNAKKSNQVNQAILTNVNNINIDLIKMANNNNEKKSKNILDELSDEEREQRNKIFVQKFENITNERKAPAPTPSQDNQGAYPSDEYKDKLNNLLVQTEEEKIDEVPYLEKERENVTTQNVVKKLTDTIDDSTINVKVYSKSKQSKSENKYLQVNKVKFAFGLTMLILMLLELTVTMVIMKGNGTLYKDKMWAFQCGYAIVGIVCIMYCIPVFISPNKQTSNVFKLNYAIVFGLLAFFVSLILIYTINTFMGLSFENIKYFAPTIVAPLVLASNFIVGPLLYKVLTTNHRFYQ